MQKVNKDSYSFTILLIVSYVISLIVLFYYAWDGFDYYKTPLLERAHHLDHQNIKPGGLRGHGLGVIGTFMMLLLLLYSLRKRSKIFGNIGQLTKWLDFHIFLGIMGPLFVVLHTAFKLNGIVALSFWSMIAVAVSGILGRYLYLQIPRNINGHEMEYQELVKIHETISPELSSVYGIDDRHINSIEQMVVGKINVEKSLTNILFSLLLMDIQRFFRVRRIRHKLSLQTALTKNQIVRLIEIIKKKAILHRRIILWNKIHQLFHYWHVIHKPFAIIMYIIMVIHVVLTLILGYKWVF